MIPKILKKHLFCLVLCFTLYSLSAFSQEVLILTTNGEKINGTIQETEISVKTESGIVKIPLSKIALIDFVSNADQVSAKAYLHLLRGRQFLKDGIDDMALTEFKTAVSASPNYIEANYELAKLLEKMGKKTEAMEYIGRVIAIDPTKPGMENYIKDIGDWYLNKKDFGKAAEMYTVLFQKYPKNSNSQYSAYKAGFLYAWELKDNKKALTILESAVDTFPDDPNVPKALYEIGRLYTEEGNLDSAEKTFTQLISGFASDERVDNAHYSLAKVYQQKKQYDKAMQEITKVLNESSDKTLIESTKKMIDEFAWNLYTVLDKLPTDDVRIIKSDKDCIWVGTASGVAKLDLQSDSFIGDVILPNTEITALAVDESFLWIGTSNSWIKQYDKTKGTLAQNASLNLEGNPTRVLSLITDKNSVWVGTESGIYRYDKIKHDWKHYTSLNDLPDNKIVSMASTPKSLWCGSLKNGISVFDYNTQKWQSMNTQSGFSGKSIPNIVYYDTYVWFAWYDNYSNGVSNYEPNKGSWQEWPITEWEADTTSNQTQNITSSMINIGAGEKEAWVGTDSVAIFYDYQASKWSQPFNYPSNFTGSLPACIVADSEYVWFATSHGLARLNKKVANEIQSQNLTGSGQ
jgi:tetratricopeptide (TPR) repeat protein